MVRWILREVMRVARLAAFTVARPFSERRTLTGIEVWSMADHDDDAVLLDKVGAALRLLAETDPLRHRRVRRYVKRILITGTHRGLYNGDLKACVLGYPQVLSNTLEQIAAAVVHESTHARLRRAGLPLTPALAAREELLCVSQALAFLDKTEAGREEAARVRALVEKEFASEKPWFHEDRLWDDFEAAMRGSHFPERLIRLRRRLRI